LLAAEAERRGLLQKHSWRSLWIEGQQEGDRQEGAANGRALWQPGRDAKVGPPHSCLQDR